MSLREKFIAFDDRLASHGVPRLTQWWRDGIGTWLDAYEQRHVLDLTACCGRGASKSTANYKLALFFTLFGDFEVPPGERHFAIVLSRLKEEAAKGVAIISRWLTLLGIEHRPTGDVIELRDMPRGIRVVAASVAATSGWRAYFVGRDERSKWATEGTENMDASEVDTSAAAMTATHRYAPMTSFGSAWGAFGDFYDAVMTGSTDSRIVLGPTPTWIAAPHVTREDCQRKERDPSRFAREYQCIFQSAGVGAFEVDAIEKAFRIVKPGLALGRPILAMDPAARGAHGFTWSIMGYVRPYETELDRYQQREIEGPNGCFEIITDAFGNWLKKPDWQPGAPYLHVRKPICVDASYRAQISMDDILARVAIDANAAGVRRIVSDQFESFSLESLAKRHRLSFESFAVTAVNKAKAVARLRRLLNSEEIVFDTDEQLKRELIAYQERITANGISYGGTDPTGGHFDRVATLVTAMIADFDGGLFAGSPGYLDRSVHPMGSTPMHSDN